MTTSRDIQRIRDSVALPPTVGELYNGQGKLRPEYIQHTLAERAIQRVHKRAGEAVQDRGKLPPGIRQALKLPLIWVQIVNRYPWKVMWVRVDTEGRRKKGQKLCTNLGAAIAVQKQVAKKVPNATIVSRARAYDVPPELRGKLPPRWYWCPHCMKPRRYERDPENRRFDTMKKVWSKEKQRYIWKSRMVYLLVCPMCGCTNRNPIFRRSNQPWEVRRFKPGARRARPHKKRRRRAS